MQCHEMRYPDISLLSSKNDSKAIRTEKEAIHSGHFMVSHFEAEAQDDEYEVAVPVPEMRDASTPQNNDLQVFNVNKMHKAAPPGQLAIETSLTKLFQCMSLAYRQKLTSPKWNRFKGIRLRWKDKIRLNNVIWRCWHMQFIKKENTLICQFASPLDEGTHNKPEAVVLEGKYWKRKLAAVTAEYKRWRMFYRNKIMGWANKETSIPDMDMFDWQSQSTDSSQLGAMMVDEDYMELMSDTLFSTITSNQPFAFPDPREIDSAHFKQTLSIKPMPRGTMIDYIDTLRYEDHGLRCDVASDSEDQQSVITEVNAKGANLADFIQPSLAQLQPNLDDFMDPFEPFQEIFSSKLPPVPEDCPVPDLTFRSAQPYSDLTLGAQPSAELPHQEIHQSAPPAFHLVVNYPEPDPTQQTSDPKATRFYHSKPRSQTVYLNPSPTQTFVCAESLGANAVVQPNGVSDQPSYSQPRPNFSSKIVQQTFKIPSVNSKVLKYSQYQKMSASSHFGRNSQNYDLAVGTQETMLPEIAGAQGMLKDTMTPSCANKSEAFAMPKPQSIINLKSRQRTRSGSSLVMVKSKPPTLSSANSDSALNISSALLAQLLTTNNSGVYNITSAPDRVQTTQPVLKSTNIPIMPSPPKAQHQKMLPSTHANTLLITDPALTTTQSFISPVRPSSSPESSGEFNIVQSLSSPRNLNRSPTSPLMFTGPVSPSPSHKQENSLKPVTGPNEHRRVCHINAEQKRRYNIKNGFDVLHSLIPHLTLNPNVKLSKAVMLQKGAEYIRQLQAERARAKEDVETLKCQIESLSASIGNCQSLLPATGAPVSHRRTTKMKEMFDDFVRARTAENWKFWIFSVLFEPLLQSFNCSVSTASYEDLYRSTLIWVEQHCSLVELRPAVLNSLKNLCTATEILSNPSKLPEEARAAVNKKKS